jgi:hypothetical protein
VDYREFQRRNPEWPKRLKDADGRMVRLKKKVQRRDGREFAERTVAKLYGTWRGRISLQRLDGKEIMIRGIHPGMVEMLSEGYQPCLFCEGIGDVHGFKPSKPHHTWIETCPRCEGSGQGRRAADLTELEK